MTKSILLDTGPLEKIAHPRSNPKTAAWLKRVVASGGISWKRSIGEKSSSHSAPSTSDSSVISEVNRARPAATAAHLGTQVRAWIFVEVLRQLREETGFLLNGWVLVPDHCTTTR